MTTETTNRPAGDVIEPRNLINSNLFEQLTTRIADEHQIPAARAEQIMEQALGFLYACALNPGQALSPSPQVDIGWHTFILHTRAYAEFCETIAGRFIHHLPDAPGQRDKAASVARLGHTMQAMRQAGVPVEPDLWLLPADCSQCYQGCVDDPASIGGPQ
jgi:hypothetical protein